MASASPSRRSCSRTAASDARPPRSLGAFERGQHPPQRLQRARADRAAHRDDGRARLRPELHDRRPAAQPQHQLDRPGAVPRQHADPRRPVPLDPLSSAPRPSWSSSSRPIWSGRSRTPARSRCRPTATATRTRRSACCSARAMTAAAASSARRRPSPRPAPSRPGSATGDATPAAPHRAPPARETSAAAAPPPQPAVGPARLQLLMTARAGKDRTMSRLITLAAVSALGPHRRLRGAAAHADAGQQYQPLFAPPAGGRAHQFRVRPRHRRRRRLGAPSRPARRLVRLDRPSLRRQRLDRRAARL